MNKESHADNLNTNDMKSDGAKPGSRNPGNPIVLKGADVAGHLSEAMKAELEEMKNKWVLVPEFWVAPKLAIFRVGERSDDLAYEKGIVKRFSDIGLAVEAYDFPEDAKQSDFLGELRYANEDPDVQGILVFRPLPEQIDDKLVAKTIEPAKDVDGISPVNMAKVFIGDPDGYAPCTAVAVIAMLDYAGIELKGKRIAIVGRSLVVGKPLSMLFVSRDATVTICHSKTGNLSDVCREADILVACVGKSRMLGAEYIKPGAVVIDVGINTDECGTLCGDVDFEAAASLAGAITPVPGGVGTVTTAILAQQLIRAAKGLLASE